MEHCILRTKTKNKAVLSASVRIRYRQHFRMSFLSKVPLTYSLGKAKTSITPYMKLTRGPLANMRISPFINLFVQVFSYALSLSTASKSSCLFASRKFTFASLNLSFLISFNIISLKWSSISVSIMFEFTQIDTDLLNMLLYFWMYVISSIFHRQI